MKAAPREHIEAKIINCLRDLKAPGNASQIAVHIQETREDTLRVIQRLVKDRTIKGNQDLALFNTTGETVAYTLADPLLQPTLIPPAVPPSQLRRGPTFRR
jgi:ribosomal protein S28E/S33